MTGRPPIERISIMVGHLNHGHRVNAETMAREFEVSRKSIDRDIEFMRDRLQIPLYYDRSEKTYKINRKVKLPWFAL